MLLVKVVPLPLRNWTGPPERWTGITTKGTLRVPPLPYTSSWRRISLINHRSQYIRSP